MKDFSTFLSICSLILLFGYITYDGGGRKEYPEEKPIVVIDPETPPVIVKDSSGYQSYAISYALPEKINFAGEAVPLELPDVYERLDKELQINIYTHSNTLFLIKRANRWLPQMEGILKKYKIPDDFKYVALVESNLLNGVSPKGAVGFWQILKSSGKENGLEISKEVDERYDPLKSTVVACKYLRQAYKKFGNWTLAAASYNRGITGLYKAIKNQNVNSYYDLYLNDETSRYIFRILAIREIIENSEKYGFSVDSLHLYKPEKLRYVKVEKTVPDLITFSKKQGINYKLLKRYNPWLREERLTVKRNNSYQIAIPVFEED